MKYGVRKLSGAGERSKTVFHKYTMCFAVTAIIVLGIGFTALTAYADEPEIHKVTIRNYNFFPPDLMIAVGDTVIWTNKMNYGHWVISGRDMRHNNLFFSYMLLKGDTFSFTFRRAGEYPYYCPIHSMQAIVTVLDLDEEESDEKDKPAKPKRRRIR